MQAIDPATGERIDSYQEDTKEDVDRALAAAREAYETWTDTPLRERERLLAATADVLRDRKRGLAELATQEMGKPISQSIAEVEKCAWVCEHYSEYASAYLQDEYYPSPVGTTVKTSYEPLGPILAVMPWNFPYWQVFRFAAPNLTAGNVGLLKHASNVPGCALKIEDVFREAGYPEDVFQTLLIGSDLVEDIVADRRIKGVTLTGSGPAGRAVAASAGEHLKKSVLELGGSDPFVVLEDADLARAAEVGAWARNQNGGQSCIAAKRFVVVNEVYDAFRERLLAAFEDLTIGDPMAEATDVGPQARQDLLEELHEQVEQSVAAGAEVALGGEPLDREGAYYPPTVLTDVPENCPASDEELFGPVAVLEQVDDEQEAIQVANDTTFGLGAAVWTQDRDRGERIAGQIDAGCVYINQLTQSDPRIPFGGVKDSGYGRELAEDGIKEFLNKKTVWVE